MVNVKKFTRYASVLLTIAFLLVSNANAQTGWYSQGTPVNLSGVCFTDALTGTAVGVDYYSTGGTISAIIRTTDGGMTWLKQPVGFTGRINGVSFSDANNGAAVLTSRR